MSDADPQLIHISQGRGSHLGRAKNRVLSWGQFCKELSTPTVTAERFRAFEKMTKAEQDDLKSVDGWIMAAQVADNRRARTNVLPRDVLSLDYDYATPAFLTAIEHGLTPLSDYAFVTHSTRRHTDEKPRLRFFAPFSRPVTVEEFAAVARIIAMVMERRNPMEMVDKVSFRPAQMMFKPTRSIDGDWFFHKNPGPAIDPDRFLDDFEATHGDWRDISLLPLCASEDGLRSIAEKAEDPTLKKGPVGDFCRAYDVISAIEKFLPDCYAAADDNGTKPRYTYLKGTSTSGAVVEDGGLFLYSHHGSDPCADTLVNSFDLVRIHLFGELDAEVEKGTPPNKWPSYKRMVEFLADDAGYRKSQAETRYDMTAMFDDIGDEDDAPDGGIDETSSEIEDRPVVKKPKAAEAPTGWFPGALTLDAQGRIESSAPNAAVIVHNDARIWGCIAFNDFSKQIVARRSIISKLDIAPPFLCRDKINGDRWQDINDITIRLILEAPNGTGRVGYGMKITDRDINAAIVSAAHRNKFHPVRDYFERCRANYDGRERVETILIRHLGVEDSDYHREIARCALVASVARIMEPGCKFDYAIIIQGPQGIRKSSYIKALYGEDWFGELDCRLDDKQAVAETVAGKMVLELPELSGLHKSDHNAAKAFMRRQYDDVRMAYDRRTSEFPRQCVFWGTTNDRKYLRDPTGNRSYWPVECAVPEIDTDAVAAERDQIWGEAATLYAAMRRAKPEGDLPLTLSSRAAQAEARKMQESARTEELHEMWAERIADWLDEPVRLSQFLREAGVAAPDAFDDPAPDPIVVRCAFFREQVVEHCLHRDRGITDFATATTIERALGKLDDWKQPRDATKGGARIRIAGQQRRWFLRDDASVAEQQRGYRLHVTDDIADLL